jgi:hypothetical protein
MDQLASRMVWNAAKHVLEAWQSDRWSDAYAEGQIQAYYVLHRLSQELDPEWD